MTNHTRVLFVVSATNPHHLGRVCRRLGRLDWLGLLWYHGFGCSLSGGTVVARLHRSGSQQTSLEAELTETE